MLSQRNTIHSDIDCPGDHITYTCTVHSNSITLDLVWNITLSAEMSQQVAFSSAADLNRIINLNRNAFVVLEEYDSGNSARSTFTLVPEVGVTLSQTAIWCRIPGVQSTPVSTIDVTNPAGIHRYCTAIVGANLSEPCTH